MWRIFCVCVLASVSFAFHSAAHAAEYYVSAAGNDAHAGTSLSRPWQTIAKINGRIFAAGDRIFFRGGDTFSGNLVFDNESGARTKPIVIRSYGTGRAVIRAGTGNGIYIYNKAGFRIENLDLRGAWNAGTQSGNTGRGIYVYTDTPGNVKRAFLRVNNVDVSGFRNGGVVVGAWPTDNGASGYEDVRITNVQSYDNGSSGIDVWGRANSSATHWAHKNVYVGNCRAYNNKGVQNTGSNSGSGIILSDTDGGTVEGCVSYNNGELNNHGGGGPVGIWAWNANNITLQFNESYNNKTQTLDGGGFDLDGGVTNSVMQYNYSHDNMGSGFFLAQFSGARTFSNNVVRYNISQNDGRKGGYSALHVWNGNGANAPRDCEIYNNTVYITPSGNGSPRAVWVENSTRNMHFRNNLLVTAGGVPLIHAHGGQNGLLFQGNSYWSSGDAFNIQWDGATYHSYPAWQNATGQERLNNANVGLNADPLLLSPGKGGVIGSAGNRAKLTAYKVQNHSPLSNAGLNLSALFGINMGSRDYYGTTIPVGGAYDIGAHETANYLRNPGFEPGSDFAWEHVWDTVSPPESRARIGRQKQKN